eukprot:TRINITY_DN7848_c0_g2_i2.p1 TRINITY_DN7848_c0_g2~~TRINITY_DN7848_c0_g2_i2.p1  ORF type:complete len:326 (+),score=72.20 TRINITY_DN7848_c0_g2_i2:154-1131(+)
MNVYERRKLKVLGSPDVRLSLDDFFECMFLVRCKHEMEMDASALLALADLAWDQNELADTSKLFQVSDVSQLKYIQTGPWLLLLMRILIMEVVALFFPKRYPIQWGLVAAFEALREVELSPPPHDKEFKFHDSFYLATHIVYALSAYSSIKTNEREVPWLYKYCRKGLRYWMSLHRKNQKSKSEEHFIDVDGAAEAVDVLRGAGVSEATDPLMTQGTLYLLQVQKKDGSWPARFHDEESSKRSSFYDKIHPTWVATQALRDRDYKIERVGNAKWAKWISKVVVATDFGTLLYQPSSRWGLVRKKKKPSKRRAIKRTETNETETCN